MPGRLHGHGVVRGRPRPACCPSDILRGRKVSRLVSINLSVPRGQRPIHAVAGPQSTAPAAPCRALLTCSCGRLAGVYRA